MRPQRFAEANVVMARPKGLTEEQCADVHAYRGQGQVITAWRPTPEELVQLNLGEPVWLHVVGETMPPVALVTACPFTTQGWSEEETE